MQEIFTKHDIDSVIHFAAYKSVSESVNNPLKYFNNNLISLTNLLELLRIRKIENPKGFKEGAFSIMNEFQLENLKKDELKNFIKHRVNTKMADLGLSPIIPAEEIDKGALKTMKWFDAVIAGKQHTDFFANRVTNYAKGHMDWSNAF